MGNKRERLKRLFVDKRVETVGHYSKKKAAVILSVCSAILATASILGFLFIKAKFSDTDAIKAWVDENYFLGMVIMMLLCSIQVVIALIPGELLEIASGYAFGGVMGAVICTVGILMGSIIAIMLSRRFGRRLVESLYPREKIDGIPILSDPKKRNAMTFLLFLIPGTPKDLFTYVIGMTEMSIPLYIVLTTFARLPSIIVSTMGGGALGDDKLTHAVVIFIIAAAISAVGYLIYLRIQARHKKSSTGVQDEGK
jgi:uncharacterized membrane protein YdjX (TVP38/TMEM64 family)